MTRRSCFIASSLLAVVSALTTSASKADTPTAAWPTRPVTIVVPFAPGGNTDLMARLIGERLTKSLGGPFIVDNKGGAGGTIAADFVARAPADGYTLFMATLTQISTAPFTNKIRYDPIKDFVPIANVGGNPFVITVSTQKPYKTMAEMIEYGRRNPGKLNMGNAGVGGLTHLSGLLFARRAGIDVTEVPYKGAALALADVLSGQTDLYSGNLSEVLPYANNPKVRLMAVSSKSRIRQLPDVPTVTELFPDAQPVETWNGLVGPAGMPGAIVDRIADAVMEAHASPDFQKRLEDAGITPLPEARTAFAQRIRNDIATWKPIVEHAGIKPE